MVLVVVIINFEERMEGKGKRRVVERRNRFKDDLGFICNNLYIHFTLKIWRIF